MKYMTLPPLNKPALALSAQMSEEKLFYILRKESGLVPEREYGAGEDIVMIIPDARQEIETYFKFGKGSRASNRNEQQAVLYGHRFTGRMGSRIFLVTRAAYIYPAERNRIFVATSGRNEDDFMEYRLRLEEDVISRNELCCNTDKKGYLIDVGLKYDGPSDRIGQIHTHPGFGCFFSATDNESNESTTRKPYAYLVCDPISEDYKAMVGKEGSPARIVFLESVSSRGLPPFKERRYVSDKGSALKQIADLCRSYLKQPKTKGQFRMYFDSQGKAHIKFHARFNCTEDLKREFELVKKDGIR